MGTLPEPADRDEPDFALALSNVDLYVTGLYLTKLPPPNAKTL